MSPWLCPECGRTFRNPNQAHSCVRIKPEALLQKSEPVVREIYRKLSVTVTRFGNVHVSATKSAIMFSRNSTFLAVKPKRQWLDIEYLLDTGTCAFPVYKTIRANKSRVAHFVRLESVRDISKTLEHNLKRAFRLAAR